MENIKIRIAQKKDAGAIREIYDYYVKNTAVTFEYETPTAECFENYIEHVLQRHPYIVAEYCGKIVGYTYASPFREREAYDWCAESTIYIDKSCKRKGLGKVLYTALEDALKKQGILNIYACIGVPRRQEDEYLNFDSIKFHTKMGYRVVGEFDNCGCKFGRWYKMVWMEKSVGGHLENPKRPVWLGDN